MGANPLSYSDPKGQFAILAWPAVPAIAEALTTLGGYLVGGATLASILSMSGDTSKDWNNDPQAVAEHDAYKDKYNEPPPPFNDPCEELKWRLKREEDLLRSRKAWDAKWSPGRHDGQFGEIQSQNAIKNLKEKMRKLGCKC